MGEQRTLCNKENGKRWGVAGKSSPENEEDKPERWRKERVDGSDLALGTHHPLIQENIEG